MGLAFAGALTPLLVCALAALTGLVRPSDLGLRGVLIAETMPMDRLTAAMGISRTTPIRPASRARWPAPDCSPPSASRPPMSRSPAFISSVRS